MRKFISNLVRALFRPKGVEVEVIDPVQEFRRQLGLGAEKKGRRFVMEWKGFHVSKGWTVALWVFSWSFWGFSAAFFGRGVFALFCSLSFLLPFLFLDEIPEKDQTGMIFSRLMWLNGLFVTLNLLATGQFFPSLIPFLTTLALLFRNGVVISDKKAELEKNVEERMTELFDEFVQKHRPDLLEENSLFNLEMKNISEKLGKLKDISSRFEGELRVEQGKDAVRHQFIEAEIGRINAEVERLESEKRDREEAKGEMLQALQVFEAIKAEATAHVRLESLSSEADKYIGEASRSSDRARAEIDRLKGRILDALLVMNRAAERLGLSSVAKLNDPRLEFFESRVEEVVLPSIEREKKLHLM